MIHGPDTSTFNSVDIYDELRRARATFFVGMTTKGLDSLAPCPSEFVLYVYYARTRRYVSVLYPYL